MVAKSISHHCSETLVSDSTSQRKCQETFWLPWIHFVPSEFRSSTVTPNTPPKKWSIFQSFPIRSVRLGRDKIRRPLAPTTGDPKHTQDVLHFFVFPPFFGGVFGFGPSPQHPEPPATGRLRHGGPAVGAAGLHAALRHLGGRLREAGGGGGTTCHAARKNAAPRGRFWGQKAFLVRNAAPKLGGCYFLYLQPDNYRP